MEYRIDYDFRINFSKQAVLDGKDCTFRLCTPVGTLDIKHNQLGVTGVNFIDTDLTGSVDVQGDRETCSLKDMIQRWFRRYFTHGTVPFTPLLHPVGTEFQRTIWIELQKIPAGETRTYGDIARAVGKKQAARAVGQACGHNPIPILIPCHRVVPGGSGIGNYSGPDQMKATLINHEQSMAGREP